MARHDPSWVAQHSGPLTARQMSTALRRVGNHFGRAVDETALGKMARRRDPFHVLVACLISLRTKDEVTDVVAPRLLDEAPDAAALAAMPASRISKLIYPAGFYKTKGKTLRAMSQTLLDEHGGKVPDDLDTLLAIKGVGRKTANLVVTLGFGSPGICVDTHVHRICNHLGFVRTAAPDDSEWVLRARLPKRWWIPINDLLVTFGRELCHPVSPRCSICPVADLCHRVGVGRSR